MEYIFYKIMKVKVYMFSLKNTQPKKVQNQTI